MSSGTSYPAGRLTRTGRPKVQSARSIEHPYASTGWVALAIHPALKMIDAPHVQRRGPGSSSDGRAPVLG